MFLKLICLFSLYFSLPPLGKITDFLSSLCHPVILQAYTELSAGSFLNMLIFNVFRACRNLSFDKMETNCLTICVCTQYYALRTEKQNRNHPQVKRPLFIYKLGNADIAAS